MTIVRPILAGLLLTAVAAAQNAIQNADGTWSAANSAARFNNPMSAVIEGSLVRSRQQYAIFSQMLMAEMFNEQWRKLGREAIAAGRATTQLAPMDAAMADRIVGYRGFADRPNDQRDALARDLATDLDEAARAIVELGGSPGDLASVLAVAMESSYARFAGAVFSPARRDGLTETWRAILLSDPIVQGQGAIAREMSAGKYASALAALRRLERANDPAAKEAAGAILQSLWPRPIGSIEPTDRGYVDRGDRIVSADAGTTTFRPSMSSAERGERAAAGQYFAGLDENVVARAKADWVAAFVARHEAFAAKVQSLGLAADDLASVAAAATVLAWPATGDERPIDAAGVRQLYERFAADLNGDPAFQRMDDAHRDQVAVAWADRAMTAVGKLAAIDEANKLRAMPKSDDAMENLLRDSRAGSFEAEAAWGRSMARSLLADLFAPRKLESVTRDADASFHFGE